MVASSQNTLLYFACWFFFFFNDTATTEIYTLSLHDALPISEPREPPAERPAPEVPELVVAGDRKSTRLNSSHDQISYAVFCLKKKNTKSGVDPDSHKNHKTQ